MSELKSDVSELKSDVSELKTDVSELKSDVSELKSDVSGLRVDLASFKGEITTGMAALEGRVHSHVNRQAWMTMSVISTLMVCFRRA